MVRSVFKQPKGYGRSAEDVALSKMSDSDYHSRRRGVAASRIGRSAAPSITIGDLDYDDWAGLDALLDDSDPVYQREVDKWAKEMDIAEAEAAAAKKSPVFSYMDFESTPVTNRGHGKLHCNDVERLGDQKRDSGYQAHGGNSKPKRKF